MGDTQQLAGPPLRQPHDNPGGGPLLAVTHGDNQPIVYNRQRLHAVVHNLDTSLMHSREQLSNQSAGKALSGSAEGIFRQTGNIAPHRCLQCLRIVQGQPGQPMPGRKDVSR